MTRFSYDIFEKRREPELNVKRSVLSDLDDIWDKAKKEGWSHLAYVNFSEVKKLGINPAAPNTTHRQPIGVYAWPLWYVMERRKNNTELASFAANRSYALVFRRSEDLNGLFLQDDSSDGDKELSKESFLKMKTYMMKYARSAHLSSRGHWDIRDHYNSRSICLYDNVSAIVSRSAREGTSHVIINTLFRRMNFDFIEDMGSGTIFGPEPTQTVFLTTKGLTLLSAADNKKREAKLDLKKFKDALVEGAKKALPDWKISSGFGTDRDTIEDNRTKNTPYEHMLVVISAKDEKSNNRLVLKLNSDPIGVEEVEVFISGNSSYFSREERFGELPISYNILKSHSKTFKLDDFSGMTEWLAGAVRDMHDKLYGEGGDAV